MIDIKNIEQLIKEEKKILRSKSKNYRENFSKIENFIEKEIVQIENSKKSAENIIPEIKFKDLSDNLYEFKNDFYLVE